jgi:protein involved in polysaccharide export with SLBB domain
VSSLVLGPLSPRRANAAEGTDQLAPGFLISLSCAEDQKLNGSFRVKFNGEVDLPYSTTISIEGMTLDRFRSELQRTYQPYFRGTPKILAQIKQVRYWVEARGLVAHPANYLVEKDTTLDELISMAGGLTDEVKGGGFVRLEQKRGRKAIDLAEYFRQGQQQDLSWEGGDRVFFQKDRPQELTDASPLDMAGKVEVLGEIRNPGELTFRRNADAYYYLMKSGGPTTQSDLDKVEVIRTDHDTGKRKSLGTASLGDLKSVEDSDILIFHADRPSKFEKTVQIGAMLAGIVSVALLVIVASRSNNNTSSTSTSTH